MRCDGKVCVSATEEGVWGRWGDGTRRAGGEGGKVVGVGVGGDGRLCSDARRDIDGQRGYDGWG